MPFVQSSASTGSYSMGAPIGLSTSQPIDDRQQSMLPAGGDQPWPPPEYDPVSYMQRQWTQLVGRRPPDVGMDKTSLTTTSGPTPRTGRAFFATTGRKGNADPAPWPVSRRVAGQHRILVLGSARPSRGKAHPTACPYRRRHRPDLRIAAVLHPSRAEDDPRAARQGTANQAWLDELIDDGFHTRLLEAAEMCAALGGVFLRIVWDTSVSDKPWIQPVPCGRGSARVRVRQAAGRSRSGGCCKTTAPTSCGTWRCTPRSQNQIIHGVYHGRPDATSARSSRCPTSRLRRGSSSDLQGDTLTLPDLPFDASTVVYVPNMRPNKIWRDLGPQLWPLGPLSTTAALSR